MDLNLLYIFTAIYRERNLTRAAESLGLSPPGVSAALKRLREEFQDSLFIRKPHGVEPTVRADEIAANLNAALRLVDKAKKMEEVFDPAQESRVFLIGMSDYSQAIILPALLKELREKAPGITLAIRHSGNDSVRHALEGGTFDLMIGNVLTPLGRIRQQQILTEHFIGIVANTHPLASRSFTVDELNAYPALLTEAHGNMRWWDTPQIKVTGYLPAKIFSLSGFLAVPLLLRDSPLVCITAYRLSKIFTEGNPVTEIPMPFSDHIITIRQYWHERWHNDPAHRWLRQLIYSICQDL